MRRTIAALLACLACPVAPVALAQGVPSTESLIQGLRPQEGTSDTRGVLRFRPQGGPPSPTQPAAVDTRPQVTLQIRFGFDSATLTPQAIAVLDNLGRAMNSPALQLYKFRLVGHTDAVGTEAYNLSLSQRRANAARDYLMERWAIDSIRLEAIGMGFRELADPKEPTSPANRRVQVINEGPAG